MKQVACIVIGCLALVSHAHADVIAGSTAHEPAFEAEHKAKMEVAKKVQIARFKAHPEQLNDLKRCDWDKFEGNDNEKWLSTFACIDVSGLTAQRERIRTEWHSIECATIENCKATIRELRVGIENIRRHRADAKLDDGWQSNGFYFTPEPLESCGITPLACNTNPSLSEAFREVEQYYRKLLRERDDRLKEARELLEQKKRRDGIEDQLLDAIDR